MRTWDRLRGVEKNSEVLARRVDAQLEELTASVQRLSNNKPPRSRTVIVARDVTPKTSSGVKGTELVVTDSQEFLGQTANLSVDFFGCGTPKVGMYKVLGYLVVSADTPTPTVDIDVSWGDSVGIKSSTVLSTTPVTNDAFTFEQLFVTDSSVGAQVTVTVSGTITYNLYLKVLAL